MLFSFNLLAAPWLGGIYACIIFAACFFIVYILKLAHIGFRTRKKLPPEKPPKPEPAPEPVYYIVEKKKKRAKAEYSEPKRISFK